MGLRILQGIWGHIVYTPVYIGTVMPHARAYRSAGRPVTHLQSLQIMARNADISFAFRFVLHISIVPPKTHNVTSRASDSKPFSAVRSTDWNVRTPESELGPRLEKQSLRAFALTNCFAEPDMSLMGMGMGGMGRSHRDRETRVRDDNKKGLFRWAGKEKLQSVSPTLQMV